MTEQIGYAHLMERQQQRLNGKGKYVSVKILNNILENKIKPWLPRPASTSTVVVPLSKFDLDSMTSNTNVPMDLTSPQVSL